MGDLPLLSCKFGLSRQTKGDMQNIANNLCRWTFSRSFHLRHVPCSSVVSKILKNPNQQLISSRVGRTLSIASLHSAATQDVKDDITTSAKRKYTPRRAVLYVPGNDEKKIRKVTSLNVDCAVLDCEDGVALNRKEEARHTICRILDEIDFGQTECVVRVNAVSSGLMEEDLKVVLKAKRMPHTIMVPKVDRAEEIVRFTQWLKKCLSERSITTRPYLVTYVESAMGLMNLKDVFNKALDLQMKEKLYTLDGVVFGSDDFCADIGATRTADAKELLYARQKIVTCAKAYHLQAIDMVHIDYKDLEGLRKQSIEGAQMGFTGKQVIHPGQVQVVQEAFSPSAEQIEWAKGLIDAFKQHQNSGQGAFVYQERMIDMPLLLQAKNIVELAESVKSAS